MYKSIAQFMDYHARKRSGEGVLQMPTNGYDLGKFRENAHFIKMKLIMLRFHWQLMVLIHLEISSPFTQCGQFLL